MKIIKFTRTDGSPVYISADAIDHVVLPNDDDNPKTKTLIWTGYSRHDVLEEIQDVINMMLQ